MGANFKGNHKRSAPIHLLKIICLFLLAESIEFIGRQPIDGGGSCATNKTTT